MYKRNITVPGLVRQTSADCDWDAFWTVSMCFITLAGSFFLYFSIVLILKIRCKGTVIGLLDLVLIKHNNDLKTWPQSCHKFSAAYHSVSDCFGAVRCYCPYSTTEVPGCPLSQIVPRASIQFLLVCLSINCACVCLWKLSSYQQNEVLVYPSIGTVLLLEVGDARSPCHGDDYVTNQSIS